MDLTDLTAAGNAVTRAKEQLAAARADRDRLILAIAPEATGWGDLTRMAKAARVTPEHIRILRRNNAA